MPAVALAALAGPVSFGITGPTLVLGDIAHDLEVSIPAATSVVTAYGWGIAVGTPTMGVLVARRGVRAALAVCALLIAVGAGLVLTVPVLAALVVGAGLQALGAAGMVVVAMSLADSARAMGMVTSSMAGLGALAPLIGTRVSSALSWPAALAMTVLSLAAIPAVLRGAERHRPGASRLPQDRGRAADRATGAGSRFDALGATLLVGLVTALVLVPRHPLPAGGVALAAVVLLAAHLRRTPHGFLPAALLTNHRFVFSAGIAFLLAVANFGIVYAAPELLDDLTGWSDGGLGIAVAVPYLAGGVLSWYLVARSGRLAYPVLATALACAAAAAVAAVVFGAAVLPLLFAGMATGSLAASTGQGALALHAGAAVQEPQRVTAMGLFNLCYLLGAAFGPAIAALAVSS
ncbi:MFS transporter [Streptomyces sp. N2-109]|uniref:Tetracycline resistance protein n=1 Tax=Streptomyces gossypii TaxID=2883101 RepID=A0ABT2JTT8_9ACTN|nr:MFS transporter [Streptomyces gossypii]MCT2590785.1 MFS transporter [Streptomyces gossypii]